MSISMKSLLTNLTVISLCSISGSIIWQVSKDIYYDKMFDLENNNKSCLDEIKDMINFNLGTYLGFGLGICYIYTERPFFYLYLL